MQSVCNLCMRHSPTSGVPSQQSPISAAGEQPCFYVWQAAVGEATSFVCATEVSERSRVHEIMVMLQAVTLARLYWMRCASPSVAICFHRGFGGPGRGRGRGPQQLTSLNGEGFGLNICRFNLTGTCKYGDTCRCVLAVSTCIHKVCSVK